MGTTSIAAICTVIHDAIEELDVNGVLGANGLHQVQNYDELTEGINDAPLAQIYWESLNSPGIGEVPAYTLPTKRFSRDLLFRVDVYVTRRNHLDENMRNTVIWADRLWDKIEETLLICSAFGDDAIWIINWSMQRVVFSYGNTSPPLLYPGVRCELTVRVV
jgi:hypothetical protein